MAKVSSSKSQATRGAKASVAGLSEGRAGKAKVVAHKTKPGPFVAGKARFDAVMQAAEKSGLLSKKSGRIGGWVSRELIEQAKRKTGIETDTEVIEFALATVALEDNFAAVFKESRGSVDPELKLGF